MPAYNKEPDSFIEADGMRIPSFLSTGNIDSDTAASFGDEWSRFSSFSEDEIENIGSTYFDLIPDDRWENDWKVLDAGCGSGRWSRYLSTRVAEIEGIDPASAHVAAVANKDLENFRVAQAGISDIPFSDQSFDGVVCLGVLHHMPNTSEGINNLVQKLKIGGWALLYLYYALDNRSTSFKVLWKLADLIRKVVSKLPLGLRNFTCDLLALFLYMPLILMARLGKALSFKTESWPLSYYIDKSFRIIHNDARDRFGTPLEKRFSKSEIQKMMEEAGLRDVEFSSNPPYWHAIGFRR